MANRDPNPEPAHSQSASSASAYSGIVLLGWMERQRAVRFLIEDCLFEPPLTLSEAENLWSEWRNRAAALPPREATAPPLLPLTSQESAHAERFLAYLSTIGVANVQPVKIDPLQLVVMQHCINIDVAASYAERYHAASATEQEASDALHSAWLTQTLPLSSANPNLNIHFTRRNLDTDIDIDLPHAEFIFGVHPQEGFGPKELMGHVTVLHAGNRMALGKGYHRLYGRVLDVEAALPRRLSLVGLDHSAALLPPAEPGNAVDNLGLDIFGDRPPLFADFFTEGHAMPVVLKRKRYQLQIRSRWVAIDVDEP